jgi:hypothetical protein
MKFPKCPILCTAAVIGLTLGGFGAASAETIYYGLDSGAGPGDGTPTADGAMQSYAQLGGEHFTLDFESASGSLPTLGYGEGLLTFSGENLHPVLSGVAETTYPWASSNPYGFDTTEGTGQFFEVAGTGAGVGTSSSVTLDFSESITAFGAYFSSLESAYGQTWISYTDYSGYHEYLLPGGEFGQSVLFWGIHFVGRVTSVTFTTYNSGWGRDIYGIDDIRVIINPEPGSLLLLGTGLLGAGYAVRRRQRSGGTAPPSAQ